MQEILEQKASSSNSYTDIPVERIRSKCHRLQTNAKKEHAELQLKEGL